MSRSDVEVIRVHHWYGIGLFCWDVGQTVTLETDLGRDTIGASAELSTNQIAKTLGSTSIRHRSDTKVSARCLIDVDPMVLSRSIIRLKWCVRVMLILVRRLSYIINTISVEIDLFLSEYSSSAHTFSIHAQTFVRIGTGSYALIWILLYHEDWYSHC